jgi:hypothetical protein
LTIFGALPRVGLLLLQGLGRLENLRPETFEATWRTNKTGKMKSPCRKQVGDRVADRDVDRGD